LPADASHETSFFSDGDEGAYQWEFEDVPQTSNRWMYFTAVAIVVGLTALVLGWFLVDAVRTESSDAAAVAEATEETDAPAEEPAAQNPPAEPVVAAAPAEDLGAEGLNPEQASKVAGQDALGVQAKAQGAAMLLAGRDPSITGKQPAQAGSPAAANPAAPAQADLTAGEIATDEKIAADEKAASDSNLLFAETDDASAPVDLFAAEKPAEKPPEPAGDSFEARLDAAEAKLNDGRNDQALRELRKLSAEKAGSSKTAYLHGLAALGVGRYGEAAKQLSRADKLGYNDADMYLDMATAYQLSGDIGKARGAYKKFLAKQPT
jgi:tetratricopeptide (TPR) repeat protein